MDRQTLTFLARLDEQAERYDDMVGRMKLVATGAESELTLEERNLLAIAYKNVVGSRRASWRILASIESESKLAGASLSAIKAYREKVARELHGRCSELLAMVDANLLPATVSEEGRVFYHKTKGDYFRYMAEIQVGGEREESARKALEAYEESSALAMAELAPTHPVRLGVALNFSVFYADILHSPQQACSVARRAFDDAIAELDTLSEDSYRDTVLIMQLLRDNIALWRSEDGGDGEPEH